MAIQYPINVDVETFTVYDTNTSAPVEDGLGRPRTGVKWGSKDNSQMIPGLDANIKWLIEVKQPIPIYDSDTQKLTSNVNYDVANECVEYSYNVVDLTQEEIDAQLPDYYDYNGIKIGVNELDQDRFANLLVLINESGMPETDPIIIKDVYKASHGMTVAEYRTFIVQYGLHCYTLFNS